VTVEDGGGPTAWGLRTESTAGRVSVVMACYNAAPFLRAAVDSVLGQTHEDVELIVVDDGSTDQSREILKAYGDSVVVIEQENRGPYPARNAGIRACTGEYVAFLDADDYWAPDCLQKLRTALDESAAAVAYCGWQNIGLEGPRGEPFVPPDYEAENKQERLLKAAAPWPIHAALVRRTLIGEVGGFGEELSTCMDYDLWLRISYSRPIVRVPEVMAFYRHHDRGQITSAQWRQAKNSWLVKRNFVKRNPEQVRHLSKKRLAELINGGLRTRAYDAYWKRDLVSAQKLFRLLLVHGAWKKEDLKYVLPALLPAPAYRRMLGLADAL
jgi:glycosyltransferase involved in cell wall biosynthesis